MTDDEDEAPLGFGQGPQGWRCAEGGARSGAERELIEAIELLRRGA